MHVSSQTHAHGLALWRHLKQGKVNDERSLFKELIRKFPFTQPSIKSLTNKQQRS